MAFASLNPRKGQLQGQTRELKRKKAGREARRKKLTRKSIRGGGGNAQLLPDIKGRDFQNGVKGGNLAPVESIPMSTWGHEGPQGEGRKLRGGATNV